MDGEEERRQPELNTVTEQHEERDDEGDHCVRAQDIELDHEDVVDETVEEQKCTPYGVGARPLAAVPLRRPLLDHHADPEHDRQQAEELSVGNP
ncbi:hypothetical protein GCM10009551_063350 [Nocardiopsis tropica]